MQVNFYSLCRSGHHAIIYWFLKNLGTLTTIIEDQKYQITNEPIYFYNNVTLYNLEHPSNYKLLVKNFEDEYYFYNKNSFVIIRDFLNLICSRYKIWGSQLSYDPENCISGIYLLIDVWKQYVLAAELHPDNAIVYNKWLTDKEYRNHVSKNIGYLNIKDDTTTVPPFANGSSFIGIAKETDISKYTNRYQQIKLPDDIVAVILNDDELLELNKNVFNMDLFALLTD